MMPPTPMMGKLWPSAARNWLITRLLAASTGAPLRPRIDEQIASHLKYFADRLGGDDWLVGNTLSGADIMMSFVAEIAAMQGLAAELPTLIAYAQRLQARPAWRAALARGGPYAMTLPVAAD